MIEGEVKKTYFMESYLFFSHYCYTCKISAYSTCKELLDKKVGFCMWVTNISESMNF